MDNQAGSRPFEASVDATGRAPSGLAPAPDAPGAAAEARLRGNGYLALRNVRCEFRDGVLILRGCLPTYYLKQLAQAVVAGINGVRRVVNEIEVQGRAAR